MSTAFKLLQGGSNVFPNWSSAMTMNLSKYEREMEVFQALVNDILLDCINQFVFIYLNDILRIMLPVWKVIVIMSGLLYSLWNQSTESLTVTRLQSNFWRFSMVMFIQSPIDQFGGIELFCPGVLVALLSACPRSQQPQVPHYKSKRWQPKVPSYQPKFRPAESTWIFKSPTIIT